MPQPTFSERTPAADVTDGDIDRVSIVWQAVDLLDPLDVDLFTIERNGVAYPISFLALGAGAYRVSSDVGLFPDDSGVVIEATAETFGGQANSTTWGFDCRTSGFVSHSCDVEVQAGANNQAPTDFSYGTIFNATQAFGAHTTWPAMAFDAPAEFAPVSFGSVADFAIAQVSAARAFVIMGSRQALGIGEPDELVARGAITAVDGQKPWASTSAFSDQAGELTRATRNNVNAGRERAVAGVETITAGKERTDRGCGAVEALTGSGVDSQFDISDATLDGLNDE